MSANGFGSGFCDPDHQTRWKQELETARSPPGMICDSLQKCTQRDMKCQAGQTLLLCPAAHWCSGFIFQVSLFLYVGTCPYWIRGIHINLRVAEGLFVCLFILCWLHLVIRPGTFFYHQVFSHAVKNMYFHAGDPPPSLKTLTIMHFSDAMLSAIVDARLSAL